jgi:hypothetical protein
MSLAIPHIPPNLREPITALVQSAYLMECILVAVAAGKPFEQVVGGGVESIDALRQVVALWREHLGLTADAGPSDGGRNGPA